jgi:membrane-bound serine protease (ClpP class)
LLLFDTDQGADVSTPVIVTTAILLGGFAAFLVDRVVKARREPVRTGHEEMVGLVAEVRNRLDPEGQVWTAGALWRARLSHDDADPVPAGEHVRIVAVEGLALVAERTGDPGPAGEIAERDTASG